MHNVRKPVDQSTGGAGFDSPFGLFEVTAFKTGGVDAIVRRGNSPIRIRVRRRVRLDPGAPPLFERRGRLRE